MKPSRIMTFIITVMMVLAVCIPSAFAASGDTNVVFGGGPVSISTISIASFGQITLTGLNQTAQANVGDFTVTDARGNGKGWSVQVSATRFKNGTSMLHDGALTLSGTRGAAVGNSDSFDQAYIASPLTVTTTPAAYIVVPTSKGKGSYNFTGGNLSLDIWPSEVMSGTYSATVTFDAVPNVN